MASDTTQMTPPFITTEQMVEVDRAMVEEYAISLVQMMENAGRNLAHLARTRFLQGDPRGRRILVLAGTGGNGGGGLVCARRLHNWGGEVQVFATLPRARYRGVSARQMDIAVRMNMHVVERFEGPALPAADLVIDALIGYSLRDAPTGVAARLIDAANALDAPVLSLDVPSGLDATTGKPHEPAITATATLTLALPKSGLRAPAALPHVGELYLADIGVPPELYGGPGLGLSVGPVFAEDDIIRIF